MVQTYLINFCKEFLRLWVITFCFFIFMNFIINIYPYWESNYFEPFLLLFSFYFFFSHIYITIKYIMKKTAKFKVIKFVCFFWIRDQKTLETKIKRFWNLRMFSEISLMDFSTKYTFLFRVFPEFYWFKGISKFDLYLIITPYLPME